MTDLQKSARKETAKAKAQRLEDAKRMEAPLYAETVASQGWDPLAAVEAGAA